VKILAVDTALGACSTALLDGETVLAHTLVPMERGHAEALAPMVEEVMRKAGVPFSALDQLAVTTGPGTFTGQRVGLAFMRGLKVALRKPLIGVTTLSAMAAQAMAETKSGLAAALHDARRGEVYFGLRDGARDVIAPAIAPLDDAVAQIFASCAGRPPALAGTAGESAASLLAAKGLRTTLSTVRHPDALYAARLARLAPEAKETPRPLYLRPSDARLPGSNP
jgi:tRNA threonylcarbamoyl adenosine modification protein YeaZ